MQFAMIDRGDAHSQEISLHIKEVCETKGWTFDPHHPDLVFCIGGDGTLLRAIHHYLSILEDTLFLGIHTGTLGFFTDYTDDELLQMLEDIEKEPRIEESPLLQAWFPETGQCIYALNEIRLESVTRTLRMNLSIDGEFFEQSNGSGICVCSQAGSTGVNRALNGAVIDAGLKVIQLTEIMPIAHKNHHSLRNPFIMNDRRVIAIDSDNLQGTICSYDHLKLDADDFHHIEISTSQRKVRFARYRPYSYLKRLKNLY